MQIEKLTLQTADLKGTISFYTSVLHLEKLSATDNDLIFTVGHTKIRFVETKESHPTYHFAFAIPNNKLNEALEFIQAKIAILPYSAESIIADFRNWNAHAFYFHDNQQNILEFITHHDLKDEVDDPFSSAVIKGVCEIGIVVDNVEEECRNINYKYNLPYYKKGPRLPNFSVMGDETGLFIVSKTNRGWIPNQQPALRYFTEVEFNHNDHKYHYKLQ